MKKNGYVYFFKHSKLKPIKIGYTLDESINNRFNDFKVFSPYNAEIVGFIESDNAQKLEHDLHRKYKEKRLNGEWFDITIEDVKREMNLYNSEFELKRLSNFYIEYLNKFSKIKDDLASLIENNFEEIDINNANGLINTFEITNFLNEKYNKYFSTQKVAISLNQLGYEKHRKTINGKKVRGYSLKLI